MYCSSPTIILSKTLYRYMSFGRKLVYTDGKDVYPLGNYLPSPTSVGATHENYKNWNVLTEDGELIPLFIEVPCGKCLLCREKKLKEWSTRATCETAAATYPPLFVTLTYDPINLPKNGVEKKDVQNFLKRFRENWYRKYNERLKLRYFAASEYGSVDKTANPHYHFLFWNIPNKGEGDTLGLLNVYNVIAKSWSHPCTEKEYKSCIYERKPFLQYKEDDRLYRLIGKVDVSPDRGMSASYCAKYMRKPKDVPPQWSNPTFYLSSRRGGGIGVPYLVKQFDSFQNNPGITSIPVPNKKSLVPYNYALPRCFREKLFPSLSCVLPCYIRTQIARFETLFRKLSPIYDNDGNNPMLMYMRDSLREHYGRCYDFVTASEGLYHHNDPLIKIPHGYLNYYQLDELFRTMSVIYVQLYEYQPNLNALERSIMLKDKRIEILSRMKIPDIDVSYEEYKIKERIAMAKLREKI